MEIEKTELDQYKLTFTKDEWELVAFFCNYMNENYDEIDETILDHFKAQNKIEEIIKIINSANKEICLTYKVLTFFSRMLYTARIQFDELLYDDENDPDEIIYDKKYELLDDMVNALWNVMCNLENKRESGTSK